MEDLRGAAAAADEEMKEFEAKFLVQRPEDFVAGRPDHLVVDQMVVFLGDDTKPWVGKLVANDGHSLRVHWYRSAGEKLSNRFTPILKVGKPEEDVYLYRRLPIILDWGFSLVEKKIPDSRIKIIETTLVKLQKKYKNK